jgi:hypothetical protein
MVLRRNRAAAECLLRRPLASSGGARVPTLEPLEPRVLLDGLTEQQAIELLNVSPALFVANEGQWADESVRFVFNGRGASVAHTDSGLVFELFRQETQDGDAGQDGYDVTGSQGGAGTAELESLRFSASFDGANAVTPVGRQQAETMFNFLVGDSSSHRSNVPG